MKIPTATDAHAATKMTIHKRQEKAQKAKEQEWNKFLKEVDRFFKTVLPKYIKIRIKEGEFFGRIDVYHLCGTLHGAEKHFLTHAIETLEPLGYKNIKLDRNDLVFDWSE